MNQRVCVGVFKYFNQLAPTYLSDVFIPQKTVINTRNSMYRLKMQINKSNMGQNSLSYLGPKLWNILPDEIKSSTNTNSFKHKKLSFLVISKNCLIITPYIISCTPIKISLFNFCEGPWWKQGNYSPICASLPLLYKGKRGILKLFFFYFFFFILIFILILYFWFCNYTYLFLVYLYYN